MAKQACIIELDTLNKAITYLGNRPYTEVNSFLSQLLVEANATLHDIKSSENVSKDEEKQEEAKND